MRLEPYPAQAQAFVRTAGAARWLSNHCLAYRNEAWLAAKSAGATGLATNLGYIHLCEVLTELRQRIPWLAAVPAVPLRGALRSLDQAFESFFSGRGDYPRFKSRGEAERITYGDPAALAVSGQWVRLPQIGWVKMRLHRPILGKICTATVSREGPHWYVSFSLRGDYHLPNAGEAPVGLDAGVVQSVALSTGESVHLPVPTQKEERRLRWLQRQVSRRQKGSSRRQQARERLAKLRRHLVARRRDASHKLSTRLATTHRVIVIEDLKLQNMTASAKGTAAQPGRQVRQKAGLNRAVLGQAHGELRRMLAYKCARSGATLIAVSARYTSQTCSQCCHCAPENRESQAAFRCLSCGFTTNADYNASLNILAAGLAVSAQGGSEVTPAGELRTLPTARRRQPSRRRRTLIASALLA
jgi:putative transposase